MTQRERYYNDPEFHVLVDYMVNFIVNNKYTPSEMKTNLLIDNCQLININCKH